MTSACAVLATAAVLLDGFAPPALGRAFALRWIDLAAVACVVAGLDWRALRSGEGHGTPIDGLLLGALAIGTVQAAALAGREGSAVWLAQLVAGCGIYYGLASGLRRSPAALETLWRTLAAAGIALGVLSAWALTGGLPGLARQEAFVDANWAGRHTLVKAAGFLALALAGRALERDSSPLWRLSALLAALATGLHLAAGGHGLRARALARLDDPVFFSTLSLTLLLAFAIVREAWALGGQRRAEGTRWRAVAVATAVIAAGGALGEASGGEGVRLFVGLVAAVVVTVRELPAAQAAPLPLEAAAGGEPEERALAA